MLRDTPSRGQISFEGLHEEFLLMREALNDMRKQIHAVSDTASQANQVAVMAMNNIAAHEKICDIRYKNIDEKLDTITGPIDKLTTSMGTLTGQAYQAIGMWKATLAVSVVLGIIYTVTKLSLGG